VEQTVTAWLIPALTLVVGIAVGFVLARLAPNAAPSRTQRQMDEMQARFEAYQNEVVTHFNTTASLVKNSPRATRTCRSTCPTVPTAWPWTN